MSFPNWEEGTKEKEKEKEKGIEREKGIEKSPLGIGCSGAKIRSLILNHANLPLKMNLLLPRLPLHPPQNGVPLPVHSLLRLLQKEIFSEKEKEKGKENENEETERTENVTEKENGKGNENANARGNEKEKGNVNGNGKGKENVKERENENEKGNESAIGIGNGCENGCGLVTMSWMMIEKGEKECLHLQRMKNKGTTDLG